METQKGNESEGVKALDLRAVLWNILRNKDFNSYIREEQLKIREAKSSNVPPPKSSIVPLLFRAMFLLKLLILLTFILSWNIGTSILNRLLNREELEKLEKIFIL